MSLWTLPPVGGRYLDLATSSLCQPIIYIFPWTGELVCKAPLVSIRAARGLMQHDYGAQGFDLRKSVSYPS